MIDNQLTSEISYNSCVVSHSLQIRLILISAGSANRTTATDKQKLQKQACKIIKKETDTSVSLGILLNFLEHFFCRTSHVPATSLSKFLIKLEKKFHHRSFTESYIRSLCFFFTGANKYFLYESFYNNAGLDFLTKNLRASQKSAEAGLFILLKNSNFDIFR